MVTTNKTNKQTKQKSTDHPALCQWFNGSMVQWLCFSVRLHQYDICRPCAPLYEQSAPPSDGCV